MCKKCIRGNSREEKGGRSHERLEDMSAHATSLALSEGESQGSKKTSGLRTLRTPQAKVAFKGVPGVPGMVSLSHSVTGWEQLGVTWAWRKCRDRFQRMKGLFST